MVALKFCEFALTDQGCLTRFSDGSFIFSYPHDTHHYHVISHRCGYGDDILSYCRDHDFLHSFCEEFFNDRVSPVLWSLAHGEEVVTSIYEEIVVQTCQRWLRSNERPIVGGVDWDRFKQQALSLFGDITPSGVLDLVQPRYSCAAHLPSAI